jgi:phage shock protein PspC (stress-responsive transcriptional regulator)
MENTEVIREPRRLARTRDGRWLGGVATGLGRYFDLNPMIYRVAFAALTLAGGTGLLLYAAAWLVIPDEGEEDSIAAEAIKNHRDRPALLVGVGLLGFAAILALSSANWWPSPGNLWIAAALAGAAIVWWQTSGRDRNRVSSNATAPAVPLPKRRSLGPVAAAALIAGFGIVAIVDAATGASIDWRIVLAVAAVGLGGLIAAGAATGRGVGSVVALGLLVLAVLAVAAAVRVPLFAGVGDRLVEPTTVSGLDRRYELGIGNLDLELGRVPFPVGETHVKATLGLGRLRVTVPPGVTVRADGHASSGEVSLLGRSTDGTSVDVHTSQPGADPTRVLVLDARVGFGQVEVVRG